MGGQKKLKGATKTNQKGRPKTGKRGGQKKLKGAAKKSQKGRPKKKQKGRKGRGAEAQVVLVALVYYRQSRRGSLGQPAYL